MSEPLAEHGLCLLTFKVPHEERFRLATTPRQLTTRKPAELRRLPSERSASEDDSDREDTETKKGGGAANASRVLDVL
jgi:hypothetical protein